MSVDRQLVERIKERFARRSSDHLYEIAAGGEPQRWSAEAVRAAAEVLRDRSAGIAPEPTEVESDPPASGHDVNSLAWTAGLNLLTLPLGWMVLPANRTLEPDRVARDEPIPFGEAATWVAVGTTETAAVVTALGLRGPYEAAWAEGLEAAGRAAVFVTPPLGEWTLAVSAALLPTGRMDELVKPLLERLSGPFGEAQYFCNHPEAELYAWARASDGRLVRGYAWLRRAGGVIWDEGTPSDEEQALGVPFAEPASPNADAVLQLASFWSVDPTTLDEHFKEPTMGRLGEPATASIPQ